MLIADFHIHSKYSRATSKYLDLPHLYQWAKLKGIQLLGTGDFTHPAWFQHLSEQLQPAAGGLYQLRPETAQPLDDLLPSSVRHQPVWFVPTVEISNIYKRAGKVRRLHNLVIAKDLKTAAQINQKLGQIGNLKADGRPILGLDSQDLLNLVLEVDDKNLFIPAHIWTPWFAMFGSKSGFDSLEQAFGQDKQYIYAVETGLSADPAMCRRIPDLDQMLLVSNSDAHSFKKLGREANLLDTPAEYNAVYQAIKTKQQFVGTIEFFPQEGKYYADGHAKCGIRFTPQESKQHQLICPKCGKPLTLGVLYRVEQLADDQPAGETEKEVHYIIPLPEILSEILKRGVNTKTVERVYFAALEQLGNEFDILLNLPIERIAQHDQTLAVAIQRLRQGQVYLEPGYDGVFGVVKVFAPDENVHQLQPQLGLFV